MCVCVCYSLAPAGGMKVSSGRGGGRVSGRGRAWHRAGSAEFQKIACKREETDQIKSKKEHDREREKSEMRGKQCRTF